MLIWFCNQKMFLSYKNIWEILLVTIEAIKSCILKTTPHTTPKNKQKNPRRFKHRNWIFEVKGVKNFQESLPSIYPLHDNGEDSIISKPKKLRYFRTIARRDGEDKGGTGRHLVLDISSQPVELTEEASSLVILSPLEDNKNSIISNIISSFPVGRSTRRELQSTGTREKHPWHFWRQKLTGWIWCDESCIFFKKAY